MSGDSKSGSRLNVLPVCDWLNEAKIYNNKLERVLNSWLLDTVEVIVLYFSMRHVDRYNIMQKFCKIYERASQFKLPFEVINVPMDEQQDDMFRSYNKQADWCTLRHDDPLIPILQYRYGITSVPHLLVMKTDGTIVSSHGILDLDTYGSNALLTWMSTAASRYKSNRGSKVFGTEEEKPPYQRRFSVVPGTIKLNIDDLE